MAPALWLLRMPFPLRRPLKTQHHACYARRCEPILPTPTHQGTGCFFTGFALVVVGWAMTGMLFETYGLLQLFRDFLPTAMPFLRKMPVIGYLFSIPAVKSVRSVLLCDARSTTRYDTLRVRAIADPVFIESCARLFLTVGPAVSCWRE